MRTAAQPMAFRRLLSCCAVLACALAACGSSSPRSSIALAGALTAETSGDSIIACGAQPRERTVDATTFEMQVRVHSGGAEDRLTVAIHDGTGGAGSYHVRPVHGPLTVQLYLQDSVTEAATSTLAAQVRAAAGVVAVRYESKDEAAAEAEANNPDLAGALATLGSNPLPASLVVSVNDTRVIPTVEAMGEASRMLDTAVPWSAGSAYSSGINPTQDPRGIGEVDLYAPEGHATVAAPQPDYAGEGTLTLNPDGRSGSVFAELVSQAGKKVGVSGSFAC